MPLNFNAGKSGSIEVTEDATHFLVRIHPEDRDRAKRITGRQWDGDRKAWVYLKEPATYEALVAEFQNDADLFEIRRPKTKRPTGIEPPVETGDDELEEFPSEFDAPDERHTNPAKLQSEMEQIRLVLESLRDVAAKQDRTLEELRGSQAEHTHLLSQLERSTDQASEPEVMEVLPGRLDLTKQKEIELLEQALILIASSIVKEEYRASFVDRVSRRPPLTKPIEFIGNTHEFLRRQLIKIVGDKDPRQSFKNLVYKADRENLIYYEDDPDNPDDKPKFILLALNTHRNRSTGHGLDLSQWDEWNRSILYLMNLALIWSKVIIDPESGNE
ncbi:hypothetical protein H6F67_20745 [Microcoleus sp. FACHB-1515]|uniref:hypothetical protein n=1 Tax=Cyanophyceae TaxID=3028117 RepID=UPI001688562E|nr:hypothetical protein [Microcoleus sp. FACHB-1515]MBD2092281.1 hypothetical protein [Microcoleus sp. FACHB-1515]